jgi:hypothetical protein
VLINLKPTPRARYADVLRTHVMPRWGRCRRAGGGGAAGLEAASVRAPEADLSFGAITSYLL